MAAPTAPRAASTVLPRSRPLPEHVGERALEAGERPRALALGHALGDTGVHVPFEQLDRHAVDRLLHRAHLNQDVVAGMMLRDQALDAADLAFDPLQAILDAE